jgi:hypothetical protein
MLYSVCYAIRGIDAPHVSHPNKGQSCDVYLHDPSAVLSVRDQHLFPIYNPAQ